MNRTARRALARAQSRTPAAQRRRRWQADPGAAARAVAKVAAFSPDEIVRLAMPVRQAWEALRAGHGTEFDFHDLAAVINIALIRSESIDPLAVETCQRAQAALMAMLDRAARLHRWGCDAQALRDIPPALDLYDQLVELSTPLQMHAAMQEVLERMQAGQVLGVGDA